MIIYIDIMFFINLVMQYFLFFKLDSSNNAFVLEYNFQVWWKL